MATTRKTLTAAFVQRIRPPKSGQQEHFDAALPGFALRITSKGHKSWVVFYRVGRRLRRYTIGSYPAFSLTEARAKAREAIRLAQSGKDLAATAAHERFKPPPESFAILATQFVARYAKPRTKSWQETHRILERYVLPHWRNREACSLVRRDISALVEQVAEHNGPYMANRVLASIRRLFNWAVEKDLLTESPATHVKPPGAETTRDRVLTDQEVVNVWNACASQGWPFGPFTQTLIVTGQRRGEVAQMRWDDLDFEKQVWTLPRELTKGKRSHEVPLTPLAVTLLQPLPRVGCYTFMTGHRTGNPISGFSKAKDKLDHCAQVTNWRYHDLRRTVVTNLAHLGVPPTTISRILNHTEGGVTAIYNRYSYLEEKRTALAAWDAHLSSLLHKYEGR